MPRVPATLVLLTLLAAGCLAPAAEVTPNAAVDPSEALFALEDLVVERLALELPDGVTLDMAAFRPDVEKAGLPDQKVPVLADIGPYFGNLAGPVEELSGFDQRLAEYFVPRGYAVARVSLRGTGMSEGCFGIGDEQERKDVAAIVEFLAAQPWSNGNVAVIGKSYDGTTPWMAAIEAPPALKTIVPVSGISDMYRYTFYDGVAYPETAGFHTYYPLTVDHDVNVFDVPPAYSGVPSARQNLVRTCTDIVTQAKGGNEAHLSGDHAAPYWQARDYEPYMESIGVPVFLVHGLQDWNVKPDNSVPQFAKLQGPKGMWLGQWAHDYPDLNRFNEDWSRSDWNATLLTWFDHWLKGADNDWQRLAHVEVQDTAGTWRNYTQWPPAGADALVLRPAPDGTLATAAPEEGAIRYNDPLLMGHEPGTNAGGASFLTQPLLANATLLGFPQVDVHISTDMPGGHVVAKLWSVGPEGEWTRIAHGAKSLAHRESRDKGTPPPTNAPFNLTVSLYAFEAHVPAGHRIGLTLSTEDADLYLPSPFRLASHTLHLGPDATTLTVHARPGDAAALPGATEPAEVMDSNASTPPDPTNRAPAIIK